MRLREDTNRRFGIVSYDASMRRRSQCTFWLESISGYFGILYKSLPRSALGLVLLEQISNLETCRRYDASIRRRSQWSCGLEFYLRVPRYLVQLLTEVGLCVGAIGADQREDSRSCVEQTRKIWFWVRDLLVFRRRTGSNRNVTVRWTKRKETRRKKCFC